MNGLERRLRLGRLGGVSRREFLKLTGLAASAVGASALIQGCTAAEPTSSGEIGGPITYLGWEGYDLRSCMEEWERIHGISFQPSYIGDYPEIPAKLSGSTSGMYNLTTYWNAYAELYIRELHLLSPLDRSKIPNFENLYPLFKTGRWWVDDAGSVWGVPWSFGIAGMNYNADEIDPPESWRDLLKPEFRNRIAIAEDNFGNFIIGGQILGFGADMPNLSNEQLDEIVDLLKEFRSNARMIAGYGDLAQLFSSGEILACMPGWAAVNVWAKERGANVQMTIPSEGAYTYIDSYAIPVGSTNLDTVYAWINEAIGPDVQACAAISLACGVVNPGAVPLLETSHPEIAALYAYEHLDEIYRVAPAFDLPSSNVEGIPSYADWIARWESFKAGE